MSNQQAVQINGSKVLHPSIASILAAGPSPIRTAYFDASAIVKLLIKDGSPQSAKDASAIFYEAGIVVRTTMICFAEALLVLKRKRFFPKGADIPLSHYEYSAAILTIYSMINPHGQMQLDPVELDEKMLMDTDSLVVKHHIDHSDALQISTIARLKSSNSWSYGTFLCTADEGLADAAALESIPVAFLR